ncbi:zinc finger protein 239-like isoform X2 [Sitodiplosis mosellana]|nr:zinc finger protein 239-like isoform X2 [Sitodiplosis mosellana]XP_055298171.1 zinc finger protein 239-like isoform X2 [Sitodiplosis mosellana]XP_055298172.1 zinc finger protein 239-like isoform X2 [Sitodiplosis mosellana]
MSKSMLPEELSRHLIYNHEQVFAQPPYPYPPVNEPTMALPNGNHGGGSKRGGKKQKTAPSSGPEVYDTGRRGNFDGLANTFGWAMPPYHNLLPTTHSSRQEAPPAAPAPRASTSSEYAQNYKDPPTKRSPFTCDFCAKGYTYKWNLECHLRDEHAKEFPFQCGKCRKGFFLQTDTQEHEAKCKSRPYKCDECEYATNDRTKLTNHTRRHTGEKPYQCEFCLELFTLKHSLDRHSINQHADQSPFHCSKCGRGFMSDDLALAHEINCKCSKYECDVCEFTTRDRTKLTNHVRKHTGEKPYQCSFANCRRVFTLDRNLKRHRRDVHKFV